jgi:hypothetical protein
MVARRNARSLQTPLSRVGRLREIPAKRGVPETLRLTLRWPYVASLEGSAHPRLITKREGGGIEMTELAHRRNHDFDVALYWNTKSDELFVIVEDIAAGDRFSIEAPRGQALDVFNHPFAYATAD